MKRHCRAALLCLTAGCASPAPSVPPVPAEAPIAARAFRSADSLSFEEIRPGVTLTIARDASGPWALHVLEIDLRRCLPALRGVKAGPPLAARATTTALGSGGLAAINADFFAIPQGTPLGPHVMDGRVLVGPADRPVFAVTMAGFAAGYATLDGWAATPADTVRLSQVNRAPAAGSTALHDGWAGEVVADPGSIVLTLRQLDAERAIVDGRRVAGTPVALDPGSVAISGDDAWLARRGIGDTVTWRVSLQVGGAAASQAVGGFPVLIRSGRDVLAQQSGVRPSFGEQRHPRTAVAWSRERLFWVVVDGRQPPWSDGVTLAELTSLLLRLGARDAINLDGGGSTTLVAADRIVNRPSDPLGERAVGNALVLAGCDDAAGEGAALRPATIPR